LIAHLWEEFILNSFKIHLGMRFLNMFGAGLEPLFLGVLTMMAYWVILWWMFKKRIFIRI
jgi:heparan-alpha-glucosaminide N-acetyltransferase